jgi:two-component sensor histidine kinase
MIHLGKAVDEFEQLPLLQERPAWRYALVLALSISALAVRWVLDDSLPPGYPFLTFFPVVIVSSFLFGRGAGICAGTLCGLFAWYLFIPPVFKLAFSPASLIAMAFYCGVVAVDIALIHWMQRANARLRAAREEGRRLAEHSTKLAERSELLFQELQHRVGNNLQMVAAVLSLQLRKLDQPLARRAIEDAVSRIQIIGAIQRQLYRTTGELVPIDDFVGDVCDQLIRSSGKPGVTCNVEASTGLVLPPDAAVPLALILSEAIANTLEHGFSDRDHGRIVVELVTRRDMVRLSVRDDGHGLRPGLDPSLTDSLGLRISRILSRQLGADYTLRNADPGCEMILSLPALRLTTAR